MTLRPSCRPEPVPFDRRRGRLRRELMARIATHRSVALDLRGVETLELEHLALLEEAHARAIRAGGRLDLVNVSPPLSAILDLVRLNHLLDTAPASPAASVPMARQGGWMRSAAAGLGVAFLALGGCTTRAPEPPADGTFYGAEKGRLIQAAYDPAAEITAPTGCAPPGTPNFMASSAVKHALPSLPAGSIPFSPGDRLALSVEGDGDLSGTYTIDASGRLTLPYADDLDVVGLTAEETEAALRRHLISGGYYRDHALRISLEPLQWAPIQIRVTGAVFQPGRTLIGMISDADKTAEIADSYGDSPEGRFLAAGLRGAAGVRPDADLSAITLTRGGKTYTFDLRGLLTGDDVPDVPLVAGDRIDVPSSGCFQSALVRPSQVTPDGIRVFMSNLTAPADTNSSSAIGQFASSVPYGTKLLNGLISANCVGGAVTNRDRVAVLVSTNPIHGRTEVIERKIEDLIAASDRDSFNPFLMPNDGIACYDSATTNVREVLRTITEVLAPAALVGVVAGIGG